MVPLVVPSQNVAALTLLSSVLAIGSKVIVVLPWLRPVGAVDCRDGRSIVSRLNCLNLAD